MTVLLKKLVREEGVTMAREAIAERRMSWSEMVNNYPDQWVAVRDAEMNGPDIVSGILVAVKSDDEIEDFQLQHFDDGLRYRRTTEGFFNGITGSSVVISVD